ncbi:MAG: acyloxyacyl hydrolase, partial [Gammaproteobacteria bacterium]
IPFLEVGTGVSIFSNRRLANKGANPRFFGTRFQFMTHAGAGMRFGDQQQFEIKIRKYHYSNANVDRRNQGMDLYLLTYGYWF